jgi:hypothetical protein
MGRQPQPVSTRALDVRALLRDREFIKVTSFALPLRTKVRVLQFMDQLRATRASETPGESIPALPELTNGEAAREIAWRVDTLPPEDARAVAAYLRRLLRRRSSWGRPVPAREPEG